MKPVEEAAARPTPTVPATNLSRSRAMSSLRRAPRPALLSASILNDLRREMLAESALPAELAAPLEVARHTSGQDAMGVIALRVTPHDSLKRDTQAWLATLCGRRIPPMSDPAQNLDLAALAARTGQAVARLAEDDTLFRAAV